MIIMTKYVRDVHDVFDDFDVLDCCFRDIHNSKGLYIGPKAMQPPHPSEKQYFSTPCTEFQISLQL